MRPFMNFVYGIPVELAEEELIFFLSKEARNDIEEAYEGKDSDFKMECILDNASNVLFEYEEDPNSYPKDAKTKYFFGVQLKCFQGRFDWKSPVDKIKPSEEEKRVFNSLLENLGDGARKLYSSELNQEPNVYVTFGVY